MLSDKEKEEVFKECELKAHTYLKLFMEKTQELKHEVEFETLTDHFDLFYKLATAVLTYDYQMNMEVMERLASMPKEELTEHKNKFN